MGRGKSTALSLIHDRKKRVKAFEKRKKGLEKKAHELSTLCDVNISMIMFGPDVSEGSSNEEATVWPEDPKVTSRMLSLYENQRNNVENHARKNYSIASFFQDRIDSVVKEIKKLKDDNVKKYPIWRKSYDKLSNDQLLELGNELDNVLHVLNSSIESKETDQGFQAISSSGNRGKELETYHPRQGLDSFNYFGNELYESRSYPVETHQVFQQIPSYGNLGKELVNCPPLPGLNSFSCFGNERFLGESSSYYNNYNNYNNYDNNKGEKAIVPASFDHMITHNFYCPSPAEDLMQFNNNVSMNQPQAEYTWFAQPPGEMQVLMPCPLSSVDASQMEHGGIGDQLGGSYNF